MPTILRIGNFRFHYYSNEGNEPAHIHIRHADGECKFWFDPIILASNKGIAPHSRTNIYHLTRLNNLGFQCFT